MDEETLALLTDLHARHERQGPGSEAATLQALALSGIDTEAPVHIADIGCGTGSATLPLLAHTKAHITAVDFLPGFLEVLTNAATESGVSDRVTTQVADMAALPFADASLDAIWAEGAIYNLGFQTGITAWRRFLKPGGILVVSEITWLQRDVPAELMHHWEAEYPEVALPSEKIAALEANGYVLQGYFPLSPDCWLQHYYGPLEASLHNFLARHEHSEVAQEIVAAEQQEIALYRKYQDLVSYGMYIAKRV